METAGPAQKRGPSWGRGRYGMVVVGGDLSGFLNGMQIARIRQGSGRARAEDYVSSGLAAVPPSVRRLTRGPSRGSHRRECLREPCSDSAVCERRARRTGRLCGSVRCDGERCFGWVCQGGCFAACMLAQLSTLWSSHPVGSRWGCERLRKKKNCVRE